MASLINKVKETLTGTNPQHDSINDDRGDNLNSNRTGPATSNTAGTHSRNVANKLDPTVDSNLDSSRRVGGNTTGAAYNHGNTQYPLGGGTGVPHDGYGSSHTATSTHGPHRTDIANKGDPRVDSDGSKSYGGTAPHQSSLANKIDPRVDSTQYRSMESDGNRSYGGTTGPHSSNFGKNVDPSVDSKRDGSTTLGRTAGTTGTYSNSRTADENLYSAAVPSVDSARGGSTALGSGIASNTGYGVGSHSTKADPHSINIADKLNPNVDSNREGSHRVGNTSGSSAYNAGTAQHTLGGTGGGYGTQHPGTHSSSLLDNVDLTPGSHSSKHESTSGGYNPVGHGTSHAHTHQHEGLTSGTTSHGTHQPTLAAGGTGNKTYGSGTNPTGSHHTTTGAHDHDHDHDHNKHTLTNTGPAPNTAGPHKSDLMNKFDPRVDSDLDGSKTIGGNKTFDN